MFDAKMETVNEKANYRDFLKTIKGLGYLYLQKSVYYKYIQNYSKQLRDYNKLNKIIHNTISVRIICMPLNIFDSMLNINCEKIEIESKDKVFVI